MKVIIFGATGMVGQGVLRECLRDPQVQSVLSVSRQTTGVKHLKLREILHSDFFDFSLIANELSDLDACFFCLGVSSVGTKEADYRRITFDVTLAAAKALLPVSSALTFEYISGQGTGGGATWAKVKSETENALLQMPFKAAYMLRPGLIIPLDGIQSKTALYRIIYAILRPLLPLLNKLAPNSITDTQRLGRAMIRLANAGAPKNILEMADIAKLI